MAVHRSRGSLIPAPPIETKIFPVLLVGGLLIVLASLATMAVVAAIAKAVRDTAGAGSGLLGLQGDLATFPAWVFYLKVTGLTLLWLAIIVLLNGIVKTVRVRATAMTESLTTIVGRSARRGEGEQ
jgi:hypothetical protein